MSGIVQAVVKGDSLQKVRPVLLKAVTPQRSKLTTASRSTTLAH